MRKRKPNATPATGQTKASPNESEIHPSHKPAVYALCISPLQGARAEFSARHIYLSAARENVGSDDISIVRGCSQQKYHAQRFLSEKPASTRGCFF